MQCLSGSLSSPKLRDTGLQGPDLWAAGHRSAYDVHLQRLPEAAPDTFVTLNPKKAPRQDAVIKRLTLAHPVFSSASYAAQQALPAVQVGSTCMLCMLLLSAAHCDPEIVIVTRCGLCSCIIVCVAVGGELTGPIKPGLLLNSCSRLTGTRRSLCSQALQLEPASCWGTLSSCLAL